jgi:hypothetical protein
MPCFICQTCGTQFADSPEPPASCPVCVDDRQYVGWGGQEWTSHEDLQARHALRIEADNGLLGLSMPAGWAIPQRALLLPTDAGPLLWECVSMVSPAAVDALQQRGGVAQIVISHPHFYTGMVEWSRALGGGLNDVPILLHEADRAWVMRPAPQVRFWSGDRLRLSPDVTLIRAGGHFAGSTVLHWATGPRAGGALFSGDALQVVADRRHVSFMYSYPNLIPLKVSDVQAMRDRLAGLAFDDVYGYTWGRNIIGGGRAAVDRSFDRYLRAVAA